jgi:hypothetical protein
MARRREGDLVGSEEVDRLDSGGGVARHLEARTDEHGHLGLVALQRGTRDSSHLDPAEHHLGTRGEPFAGLGEEPTERVVTREITVRVPDQRDGSAHQDDEDRRADEQSEEAAHPTNLAVTLTPPKRMSDRTRLMTTTKMMERRMARPAATPTPAGPPVAV